MSPEDSHKTEGFEFITIATYVICFGNYKFNQLLILYVYTILIGIMAFKSVDKDADSFRVS